MSSPERKIATFTGEKTTVEIWLLYEGNEYKLVSINEKGEKHVFKFTFLKSSAYQIAAKKLIEMEIKNGAKENGQN